MNAEEIRAEAISRIANAIGWDETGGDWQFHGSEEVIQRATMYVDALGDLLPIGADYQTVMAIRDGERIPVVSRRYVTHYREIQR